MSANMKRMRTSIVILLLSAMLTAAPAQAQEMEVPVDVQYKLFVKILEFDRNIRPASNRQLVIAIVFQNRFRQSLLTMERLLELSERTSDNNPSRLQIKWLAFDISLPGKLESFIAANNIDVLYIAPLRAYDIRTIAAISRANKVLTLTGVPEYCLSGIAVGIDSKGGRPLILINLEAAKSQGADFSSQLLKLARIIR